MSRVGIVLAIIVACLSTANIADACVRNCPHDNVHTSSRHLKTPSHAATVRSGAKAAAARRTGFAHVAFVSDPDS